MTMQTTGSIAIGTGAVDRAHVVATGIQLIRLRHMPHVEPENMIVMRKPPITALDPSYLQSVMRSLVGIKVAGEMRVLVEKIKSAPSEKKGEVAKGEIVRIMGALATAIGRDKFIELFGFEPEEKLVDVYKVAEANVWLNIAGKILPATAWYLAFAVPFYLDSFGLVEKIEKGKMWLKGRKEKRAPRTPHTGEWNLKRVQAVSPELAKRILGVA